MKISGLHSITYMAGRNMTLSSKAGKAEISYDLRLALEELVLSAQLRKFKADFMLYAAEGSLEYSVGQLEMAQKQQKMEEEKYMLVRKAYNRFMRIYNKRR